MPVVPSATTAGSNCPCGSHLFGDPICVVDGYYNRTCAREDVFSGTTPQILEFIAAHPNGTALTCYVNPCANAMPALAPPSLVACNEHISAIAGYPSGWVALVPPSTKTKDFRDGAITMTCFGALPFFGLVYAAIDAIVDLRKRRKGYNELNNVPLRPIQPSSTDRRINH